VCEGSAENLFILRRGQLITPPASENIVEGITRSVLMQFARDELGVQVVERTIDRSELYIAEEVLLCGTGAEVSAVIEIDNRRIGDGEPGEVTRALQDRYFAACKGEDDRYASWLTPII
jgi:branched-chain amino acid aminotransferase